MLFLVLVNQKFTSSVDTKKIIGEKFSRRYLLLSELLNMQTTSFITENLQ